jgi:uncharacterized heparinase superfamily protein
VITGGFQEAEAHYYFHPEVVIKLNVLGNEGVIYLKHKDKIYFEIQSGTVSIVDSTYHPEFGLSIDNKCLVIKFKTNESNIKFYW